MIALHWISRERFVTQDYEQGRSFSHAMIQIIYELTGQERSRKIVSSHLEVLKWFSANRERLFAEDLDVDQTSDTSQVSKVVVLAPSVSHGDPTIFTQTPDHYSSTTSESDRIESLHCTTTSVQNFLSLTLVNHCYRTECLTLINTQRAYHIR